MGNICDIFSKNKNYDDDDIIYINNKTNNKKKKEEIITPVYLIENDEPPPYNSINNNPSNPIPIVYDPSIQLMDYERPKYIDNYRTTSSLFIMNENIFNCD